MQVKADRDETVLRHVTLQRAELLCGTLLRGRTASSQIGRTAASEDDRVGREQLQQSLVAQKQRQDCPLNVSHPPRLLIACRENLPPRTKTNLLRKPPKTEIRIRVQD